jgi:CDP-diacylglycerol--serine O-phosphatidyltransferase
MMVKTRLAATKQKAFQNSRKSLPFFFTFGNALFGFLSIIQALEENYIAAVYCLIAAAFMDLLDGRIARRMGTTSLLGAELDSLADAISFCLAPCILLYAWYPGTIGYTGIIALGLYMSAGIFRLAKFNISSEEQANYFIGLPTPMAAFFVTSLVLYSHWILTHSLRFLLYKRIPFILIASIAFLMISTIPFPSFKKSHKSLFTYSCIALVVIWLFLTMFSTKSFPLPFIFVSIYIIASIVRWLLTKKS